MDQDWIFRIGDHLCDLRVAGVLIRDGTLLVQRDADGNEYALPGGHVRLGEAAIHCKRMLWSKECFWEWNGRKAHNISFYYLIELCHETDILDLGHFVPHHDNSRMVIGWLPIDQLSNVVIYPEFIRQEIGQTDAGIKHFVTYA